MVTCRSLKLPPILGYLIVGVLIGPHALALARDSVGFQYLGEFGVVFLMFAIGLEFNLPKLNSMRTLVLGLGFGQVALTMLATVAGNAALAWALSRLGHSWGLNWQAAVALGGALAMSSTAIVVKLMAERLELESEHGRRVIGVLLFQDLAVVPLLVLIPALGTGSEGQAGDLTRSLGFAALKAALLLTLLLVGGPRVMRWWLTIVARRRSEELFVLNLLLVTLGLAWITELAGLSLALGAFVAGMLIAETEFKHQVETDIRPFHDVLLGLFFITIGMKLNWHAVVLQWEVVAAITLLPVLFKFGLVTGLARLFGAPAGRRVAHRAVPGAGWRVRPRAADARHAARAAPGRLQGRPVLAAMVLSMLAAPLMILFSNRIVMRLSASDWMMQSVAMTSIARRAINAEGHIIICGYGRSGQNLARLLDAEHIPYMALDLDPDRVRQATAAGQSVVFGDAARLQSLMAAGLARARAVVVSYPDTPSALKILELVRAHAPRVPVIVRTIDDADLERLRAAGATEVVPEAIEGSLMLASHALALVGVPMRRVIRVVQEQRRARYGLLRGYFHGADDDTVDEANNPRLLSVTLPLASPLRGRGLVELSLQTPDATVVSVRRASGHVLAPSGELRLEGGDTLVLSGLPEPLARAEARLLAMR